MCHYPGDMKEKIMIQKDCLTGQIIGAATGVDHAP
jgi:hypothetical protein